MARRSAKKSRRDDINELKDILLAETSNIEDGILSAAGKVFLDDLRQKKIARAKELARKL